MNAVTLLEEWRKKGTRFEERHWRMEVADSNPATIRISLWWFIRQQGPAMVARVDHLVLPDLIEFLDEDVKIIIRKAEEHQ